MKNQAKCKLCNVIIESLDKDKIITCKCGEIAIDGGNEFYGAYARDFVNFLRIAEDGTAIEVKYIVKEPSAVIQQEEVPTNKLTRKELLDMLEENLKSMDNMPPHAMISPMTNYDYYAFGTLLLSIFRAES